MVILPVNHTDFAYIVNILQKIIIIDIFRHTLVSPGRPGHSVGSMSGDLQEQPQKHPQHAEPHIRL